MGTCSGVSSCPPGEVHLANPVKFCNKTTCALDECCGPPGKCKDQSRICAKRENYMLKADSELPAVCVTEDCKMHECCTKKRSIYWIEIFGSIRRCQYDKCGQGDVELVKNGLKRPRALALDNANGMLYWAETGNGRIGVCNPDVDCHLTTKVFVKEVGEPAGLAIDENLGFVYYVEHTTDKVWRCSVKELPCAHPTLVAEMPPSSEPYSIAIDPNAKMLYWTGPETRTVERCDISLHEGGFPCIPKVVVGPLDSLDGVDGIALDLSARKIYWSSSMKGIKECPMEEGQTAADVHTVDETMDFARGLAVDGIAGKLYIAEGITSGHLSRIRTCSIENGIAVCPNLQVLVQGCPYEHCMKMPYDVALDWSPESAARETRELLADSS